MEKGHVIEKQTERAVLISIVTDRQSPEHVEYSMDELKHLAETAQVEVAGTIMQKRESPNSAFSIGKGKVAEVKRAVDELDASLVIFNRELSGAQVRNLEQELDVKIIDRTQLILDIFAQRAKTKEGKLQVELAQLQYLLPRLSGHGVHLSRQGGGVGTRGPGETQLEMDRRHINKRINDLKKQLQSIVKHRTLQQERRKKTGTVQIALVGYTNAGKSTLLDQLTGTETYTADQLFATLDPTSRKLTLPSGQTVLLTDTVGFIQDLPHDLIAAFRATLEQVQDADLLLHVVDRSSPAWVDQMNVVYDVLKQLGAYPKREIILLNKKDRWVNDQTLSVPPVVNKDSDWITISAFDKKDVLELKRQIENLLLEQYSTYRIPIVRGDLIAEAYRTGEVYSAVEEGETIVIRVRLNPHHWGGRRDELLQYKSSEE